jgi:ubiquinone/menaquinone biosynthesis C-methylase UbiE
MGSVVGIGLWVLLGTGILFVAGFLYWAFVITEGAYLGARIVAWTYDLTASKYDAIKHFRLADDVWLLSSPMVLALKGVSAPLVLDVATGTGRMPLALFEQGRFRGYVVGLDLSAKMLEQAERKLRTHAGHYALLRHDAQELPSADETFDAVSCLEALEFTPAPGRVLSEMARVLRPGGVFVVTNRINWESKLMPGKAFTDDQMRAMLHAIGLVHVEIRRWQVYYDLIWARKKGQRSGLGGGTRELRTILHCPLCAAAPLQEKPRAYVCPSCGRTYPVTRGFIDLG